MVLLAVLSVESDLCRISCTKEPCSVAQTLTVLSNGFKSCLSLFFYRIEASAQFTLAKLTTFLCFKTLLVLTTCYQ